MEIVLSGNDGTWTATDDRGMNHAGDIGPRAARHARTCSRLRTGKDDTIGQTIEVLEWVRLTDKHEHGKIAIVATCGRCGLTF